jgi:hypothetical protein
MEKPIACAVTCGNVQGVKLSFTVSPTPPSNLLMDCEDGRSIEDYAQNLVTNVMQAAIGIKALLGMQFWRTFC